MTAAVHIRTQIRRAVVAALTGLQTAGNEVYSGRIRPLAADHAPIWLVYALEEGANIDAMAAGAVQRRSLTLRIEGRVQIARLDGDPQDLLDIMAAEAETALLADPDILSLAQSIELARTQIDLVAGAANVNGAIRLDFTVVYRTIEAAPDAAV